MIYSRIVGQVAQAAERVGNRDRKKLLFEPEDQWSGRVVIFCGNGRGRRFDMRCTCFIRLEHVQDDPDTGCPGLGTSDAYDAAYIALAEETDSVLYTCDEKLRQGHRARVVVFTG